jgi:hypothetical protein
LNTCVTRYSESLATSGSNFGRQFIKPVFTPGVYHHSSACLCKIQSCGTPYTGTGAGYDSCFAGKKIIHRYPSFLKLRTVRLYLTDLLRFFSMVTQ